MMTTDVLPSCSGVVSTAVDIDALREKVSASLAENKAGLIGLKVEHHIAMSLKTAILRTCRAFKKQHRP